MRKRITAALMVLVMILAAMPLGVFAAEVEYTSTLTFGKKYVKEVKIAPKAATVFDKHKLVVTEDSTITIEYSTVNFSGEMFLYAWTGDYVSYTETTGGAAMDKTVKAGIYPDSADFRAKATYKLVKGTYYVRIPLTSGKGGAGQAGSYSILATNITPPKPAYVEYKAADGKTTVRTMLQKLIDASKSDTFKKAAKDVLEAYNAVYVNGTLPSSVGSSTQHDTRGNIMLDMEYYNNETFKNKAAAAKVAEISKDIEQQIKYYSRFFEDYNAEVTEMLSEEAIWTTDNARKSVRDYNSKFMIHRDLDAITFISTGYGTNSIYPIWGKWALQKGRLVNGQPEGLCVMGLYKGTDPKYGFVDADFSSSITGYFSNGKLNGKGTIYITKGNWSDPDNVIYSAKGFFKDDVLDGVCLVTDANGTYKGDIKDGVINGLGKFTDQKGNYMLGRWADGEFTSGVYYDKASDTRYFGNFEGGVPQKCGAIMVSNGDLYYGMFENGAMTKIYAYDEYTDEERAIDAKARADALAMINRVFSGYSASTASVQQSTQKSISTYKERLQKAQPNPTFVHVPSYGMNVWDYAAGYK